MDENVTIEREECLFIKTKGEVLGMYRRDPKDGKTKCFSIEEKNLDQIEEMHRHVKQDYGWEKMQLMSYTGLKNMNQLLLLTMCYVYSLKSYAYQLLQSFPHIMGYSNRLWKQIYDFALYKITKVLSHCFAHVTRYNILEYGGKWTEAQQLILPCLKNGGM